jgi:hypothetical protein
MRKTATVWIPQVRSDWLKIEFIRKVVADCRVPKEIPEPGYLTTGTNEIYNANRCIARTYTDRTELLKTSFRRDSVAPYHAVPLHLRNNSTGSWNDFDDNPRPGSAPHAAPCC